MSDPQKYRTKEELEEYKQKDPIEHVLKVLKETYKVPEEDIDVIISRVNKEVEESVTFAEESPWPDDSELLKDVYVQEDYPFIVD
jgi:pyruvate dehydrogenase E1 component alpha subunit